MRLLAALLLLTVRVSGFVHDGAVNIIFPQAIQFSVNLTIPATEIASASLTILPEGRPPITEIVDVEQASLVYGEPQARLVYMWRIPLADPPPLFGQIAYQWSFTAADGSTGTLDDSFTFADPRVDWVRSLDPQGQFNVSAPRSLSPLVDSLGQVHALLERNVGRTLDDNLLIYDNVQAGCGYDATDPTKRITRADDGTTVECDAGIEDAVFAGYQLLELPQDVSAEVFVVGTLVNEAYAPFWNGKDVPAWFSGGLGQFYAPTPKSELLLPAQQAARAGTLYSLAALGTAQTDTLWRAQSFGMILYIADKIGLPGLYDLARVNAADFNTAYQQAMGAPFSALIPAWQQWIFTADGESSYGITPYQPPTPTPSATPTPSNTASDTPTVTDTPTITPTPSHTPRGARTYVPAATVTPSDTATAPPPTVTPRPPGSLPTITPTPTALQSAISQPGVQAGTVVFLVLLLALLLFLFIRLGNRR